MQKTIHIEGMSCNHCKMHVEKALAAVDGVTEAVVSLENKDASVTLNKDVDNLQLQKAVENAGYQVTGFQ